jgi:ribose transport system permease protein
MGILRRTAPILVLIGLLGGITAVTPSFLTVLSLQNLAADVAVLLLLATGQTIVILTGRIDLSVAALASFAGILIATWHGSLGYFGIVLTLLVVACFGYLQGLLHYIAQVQSFVITIGGLLLCSGLSLIISGAKAVPVPFSSNLASPFGGQEFMFGLPNSAIFALCVLAAFSLILRFRPFGRRLRAIGVSERAAILSGIPVGRVVPLAFAASAFCSGLAGLVLVADFGAGRPGLADALLLPAVAAVVVGGTAITGGIGGLWRTLLGTLIIGLLRVGISVVGAPPQYQQILYGVIIIVAVAFAIDRKEIVIAK